MYENLALTILKKIFFRLFSFVLTMLILSIVVFVFSKCSPGDPLQSFYGDAVESMSTQELTAARTRLGLDAPLTTQYIRWGGNALRGDFGLSLKYKTPAMSVVSPLLGNTLLLGGTAYLLVFLLATLLAVASALHEDSFVDHLICKIGTAVYNLPAFWLGVVFILLFSVQLKWLPSSGAYDIGKVGDILNRIQHMILPVSVLIISHLWYYAYMIRNKLLDELRQDYVLLAKAKGLNNRQIMWKHCLRNVAPTIVSIMAISIPHVLGGTYIVEAVFHYPGIGALSIESAKYHDYNLLMLLVLITGALVFLSSMVAQAVNERIDPRIKETGVSTWQR